ncbi:histidine phosphatase superfamily [Gautieria morchelliformis]|nr:histidine phosphatase superfamily [Gautieria morchelliformis]
MILERIWTSSDVNKTRIPASFRVDPGYINLSFIRHGQSIGNTTDKWFPGDEDTLTEYGREQARRLGERWANVRIDALYTSPYKRAKDTAQLLADNNHSHPEPIDCAGLVEHDFGPVVRQLMAANRHEEARCERTRTNVWGLPDRNHRPSGGDSLEDLVHRGISELRDIVLRHAVPLPAPPEEMTTRLAERSTSSSKTCHMLSL